MSDAVYEIYSSLLIPHAANFWLVSPPRSVPSARWYSDSFCFSLNPSAKQKRPGLQ